MDEHLLILLTEIATLLKVWTPELKKLVRYLARKTPRPRSKP